MKMLDTSALVISLDFELFWGVTDSRTIANYGNNIEGVWQAIPALLALFKTYGIQATWATVGMLMCRDYKQWCAIQPDILPTYVRESCSTYACAPLARDLPKLFFARPLVEEILATDGQELASHTYSHFFCAEAEVTVSQFDADLECTKTIFSEFGVKPTSLVFPRNQVCHEYLQLLPKHGYKAYRGNQNHWVYRDGHKVPYGQLGRMVRRADAYLPLTGQQVSVWPEPVENAHQLINIPASRFLRPASGYAMIDSLNLARIKKGMRAAAKSKSLYHLWWHPHNFGQHTDINLKNLEHVLQHYRVLQQEYGMKSISMQAISRLYEN